MSFYRLRLPPVQTAIPATGILTQQRKSYTNYSNEKSSNQKKLYTRAVVLAGALGATYGIYKYSTGNNALIIITSIAV